MFLCLAGDLVHFVEEGIALSFTSLHFLIKKLERSHFHSAESQHSEEPNRPEWHCKKQVDVERTIAGNEDLCFLSLEKSHALPSFEISIGESRHEIVIKKVLHDGRRPHPPQRVYEDDLIGSSDLRLESYADRINWNLPNVLEVQIVLLEVGLVEIKDFYRVPRLGAAA